MTNPWYNPEYDGSYNVQCFDCGAVWPVYNGSQLWDRAHKNAERYIDAICVLSDECGCGPSYVQAVVEPEPENPFAILKRLHDAEEAEKH